MNVNMLASHSTSCACPGQRKTNIGATVKTHLSTFLLLLVVQATTIDAAPLGTSSRRNVTMISTEGKYLCVMDTTVVGKDVYNSYAKLQISSFGLNGEVTIKGVMSGNFLAIDASGKILLTKTVTKKAVFRDVQAGGGYRSFHSKRYPSHYLATTRTGLVTSSTNSNSEDVKYAVFIK